MCFAERARLGSRLLHTIGAHGSISMIYIVLSVLPHTVRAGLRPELSRIFATIVERSFEVHTGVIIGVNLNARGILQDPYREIFTITPECYLGNILYIQ